jgi:hypothetical protein
MTATATETPVNDDHTIQGETFDYNVANDSRIFATTDGVVDQDKALKIARFVTLRLDKDLLACQSSLVDSLVKLELVDGGEAFSDYQIDVENRYLSISELDSIDEYKNFIDEHSDSDSYPDDSNPDNIDDRTEIIEALSEANGFDYNDVVDNPSDNEIDHVNLVKAWESYTDEVLRQRLWSELQDEHWGDAADWEQAAQQVADSAPAQEAYEWWLVTEWLHEQLRDNGEIVADDGQSHWWGRQCSGQSIKLDPTFYELAVNFYEKYGWN